MAAEIKEKLGLEAELIGGSGGVFDLHVEDQLVYSKHQEDHNFPEHADVIDRLSRIQVK